MDQTAYDRNSPFDLPLLLTMLEDVVADVQQFKNHQTFLNCCREITKIFSEMGGILKKAFEDIHAKCNICDHNYKSHKELHTSLIDFIGIEKAMNIHILNGQNGSHLKGTDQDQYKKYESTARTVLRLMWFLDFVYELLDEMISNKNKALSSICQNAYNKALYSHHPYHIIAAFKTGILLIPGRDKLISILTQDKSQVYQLATLMKDKIKIIKNRLWNFYKQENLTDLP